MSQENGPVGRLYLYILTATVAALIPVVLYLILSGRSCNGDGTQGSPQDGPEGSLDRLAAGKDLFREKVSLEAGDLPFADVTDVRKAAGGREAEARSLTIFAPALLLPNRAVLDEAIARLFSAMPPGTGTITAKRLALAFTRDGEGAISTPEISGTGTLDRDESSVRLRLSWYPAGTGTEPHDAGTEAHDAGTEPCSLEVIRTLKTALLFVKYECPSAPAWTAGFLPRSIRVSFTGLTVTSSSYVEARDLRLTSADGARTVLSADVATFTSARAVEPDALAYGLSPARLGGDQSWTATLANLSGDAEHLAALPPFSAASGMPGTHLTAAGAEADATGGLRFSRAELRAKGQWSLETNAATCTSEGKARVCSFDSATLALPALAAKLTAPTFSAAFSPDSPPQVRCDGWKLTFSSNPLETAKLLKLAAQGKALMDKVRGGDFDVPPLVFPDPLPDMSVKLDRGEMVIPFAAQKPISGVSIKATTAGGTIESAEVRLCAGKGSCSELDAAAGVRTDGVGRVVSASFSLSGAMPARKLAALRPEHVKGVDDLSVKCDVKAFPSVEGEFRLTCTGSVEGVTVEHPKLALTPLTVPLVKAEGEATLNVRKQTLRATISRVQIGEVFFRGALDVERLSGIPKIRLDIDFPDQKCAALLASVPRSFIPDLSDARVEGSVWFNVGVDVDVADVRRTLKLRADGDLTRCRAVTLGRGFDVDRLNSPDYLHRVSVNGEDLGLDVGPASGSWVPLEMVPKPVQAAIYGTEDLAFFEHNGFRLGLIRRAVILWFERGRFAYGGSTVSQQLVKNLFLTRHKTLSRKFQEAIIVWHMEQVVPKDRILELYINCIEYGPKIWGISRAAATYFGKHPSQLNPMEGAFLAGLKPDPTYGYLQFHRGALNSHWRQNLNRVLKRMLDMGVISMDYYQKALSIPLAFKPRGEAPLPPDAASQENRPVRDAQDLEEEEEGVAPAPVLQPPAAKEL